MYRLEISSGTNAQRSKALLLAVLVLLVGGAVLVQQGWQQLVTGRGITADEFRERLQTHGIHPEELGPTVAPLTIRGTRVRVTGAALEQPAELAVYEDQDGAVHIDENRIVSQPTDVSRGMQLEGRMGSRTTDADPVVIDVAQWPVPLHVFQQGSFIVLYPGNDPAVLAALTEIVGRPVARSAR